MSCKSVIDSCNFEKVDLLTSNANQLLICTCFSYSLDYTLVILCNFSVSIDSTDTGVIGRK